jgi:uncharacterized membrane protein
MPCTPNPTTGFFFYVPRREVIELDILVEEAANLINDCRHDPAERKMHEKLAALAETARAARAARVAATAK